MDIYGFGRQISFLYRYVFSRNKFIWLDVVYSTYKFRIKLHFGTGISLSKWHQTCTTFLPIMKSNSVLFETGGMKILAKHSCNIGTNVT